MVYQAPGPRSTSALLVTDIGHRNANVAAGVGQLATREMIRHH
jgi:hypothetical protein